MMKIKGFLYGGLAGITYGLIPLFALPLMRGGMELNLLLSFRFFIASIFIALFLFFRRKDLFVSRKELPNLLLLALFSSLTAQLFFSSYKHMDPGLAAAIFFLYPIFVAMIMSVFFKERLSLIVKFSIAIAVLGVYVLYVGDSETPISLRGVLIVLLSALTYSVSVIVVNKSNLQKMSGSKVTFYSMFFSGFYFLVIDVSNHVAINLPTLTEFYELCGLAIICTAISYISLVKSVQYIGSTYTSVLGVLEPVTAVTVSLLFFGAILTTKLIVGLFLIIFSVLLIILSDQLSVILKRFGIYVEKSTKKIFKNIISKQ